MIKLQAQQKSIVARNKQIIISLAVLLHRKQIGEVSRQISGHNSRVRLLLQMRACGYSASPIIHQWRRPLLPTRFHKPVLSSSISSQSTEVQPQIPLFLKPSTYSASLSDLYTWQNWAKDLATSIGSTFVNSDNGPDTDLLHRELKWLMDDAVDVEDHSLISQMDISKLDGRPIRLRSGMDQLYVMWKERIEERKPFQYIVGCEHWRDLVLSVQNGVLIPRPETETIVDLVKDVVDKDDLLKDGLWADLGTGSGAIAIGIGRILGKHGRVIASDISPVAVTVASYNVQRYSLQNKVEVRQGSWFEPLKDVEGTLAGFISNPPYIPSASMSTLQAEVGKHEPWLALDGGKDGTDYLIHLSHGAASMLRPGGYFAFETNGEKQSKFLLRYMEKNLAIRFRDVKIVPDFNGIQRFVTGFVC